MYREKYKKGLSISRNYKKRNKEDTEELYETINMAVPIAKDKEHNGNEEAIKFLLEIYAPFISSIASNLYKRINGTIEYEDVCQEIKYNFIVLINKYDRYKYERESHFSRYIKVMLPKYMIKWANKEFTYNINMTSFSSDSNNFYDEVLDSYEAVDNYLTSYIINNEYTEYMLKSSMEKSKSSTNKEICLNFFLGSDSIIDISKRLGISYHAVYQKISSKKEELVEFFRSNPYCGISITSTGISFI